MTQRAAETLKTSRNALIRTWTDTGEPSFLYRHSQVIDAYFLDSFGDSIIGPKMELNKNPYAIIALGGYGREEMCFHSDIDLLFLFKHQVPDMADAVIREHIYPLWDLRFEVGYAARSITECVTLAAEEPEVLTAVLDSRFICGMSLLYTELMEKIRKEIVTVRSRKVIAWLIDRNSKRHERFGDSAYRLEPNLKEGRGGLRDYHTMLWIARVLSDIKQTRGLEYFGYMSHDEYLTFMQSLEFIWDIRNRLHQLTGRKCDQLHFEYQIRIAERLGYTEKDGMQPVEHCLGDLHACMEFIKQRHFMFLDDLGYSKQIRRKRRSSKQSRIDGIRLVDGRLTFDSMEVVVRHPDKLLQIFHESQRLKIPLSTEAKRVMREAAYLVDDTFRKQPETLRGIERILVTALTRMDALDELLNTGLIGALIPEFNQVINRIQYNQYHLYPVAIHSVITVNNLNRIGVGTLKSPLAGFYRDIFKSLKKRKLLLWAGLLHDIGKARSVSNHSQVGARMIKTVLGRFAFLPKDIEVVAFLVRMHLFMIKIATRRDIHDESTAINCARKIRNIPNLKMLYLLTVADSVSTGPKAWHLWTENLLRDLYLKVLNILENGELASRKAVSDIARKKQRILRMAENREARKRIKAAFVHLPPRYLLSHSADEIIRHMALFETLGTRPVAFELSKLDPDTRQVIVCNRNAPGSLSKIAGVFTLNRIEILNVQSNSWHNDAALCVFTVKPPPDRIFEAEKWDRVAADLMHVFTLPVDLSRRVMDRLKKWQEKPGVDMDQPLDVIVDNRSSDFFTIIEVCAYDYPGLFFRITDALYRLEVDVYIAKVGTKIDQMVNIFYIRDLMGEKITETDRVIRLKETIQGTLTLTN
ncbi:MAG: [protein-PII] uridylyltransferase [Deltaproteobacteria bacterium]|nr:MAG: [protein-PII] uridylyltransferase [Deltaproteobacteria bacterium]